MAGVIPGRAWKTDRLGRFGYITLSAKTDGGLLQPGEYIRGHEFHYYESSCCGADLHAEKPSGTRSWECGHLKESLAAGFPHLFYESNPAFIERFLNRCRGKG